MKKDKELGLLQTTPTGGADQPFLGMSAPLSIKRGAYITPNGVVTYAPPVYAPPAGNDYASRGQLRSPFHAVNLSPQSRERNFALRVSNTVDHAASRTLCA